ncbi:hypothetical protein, partial [Sphingomonas sp.]|uniref:hypothetical protein n=1 Tax=Sphingomonas sp. TaxID=28214 RepID=UPI0033427A1E
MGFPRRVGRLIDHYDWSGGREAMLRFGPATGPVVVVALPLFEEANRTRAFAVTLCRALAKRGVASVLPDLPGQGESLVPTEETNLDHMRDAIAALTAGISIAERTYAVGLRSGALLDPYGTFAGRWHLAPVDGETQLRDLLRTARAGGSLPAGSDIYVLTGSETPVQIAGNPISSAMAVNLRGALLYHEPGIPLRTVRLDTDPKPADRHIPGTPLWRRAEPD